MIYTSIKNRILFPKSIVLLKVFIPLLFAYIGFNLCKSLILNSAVNDIDYRLMIPFSDCLLTNESNISSLYYRHTVLHRNRNSSYPFITGDTFRGLADHVFDDTMKDKLEFVKYGDSVFVKADMFSQFFHKGYTLIKKPFVLISHNSDYSAPHYNARYLNDEKIIAWYTSNPDVGNHSKLFPIPLGFSNSHWIYGNLDTLMHAFRNYRRPWSNRTTLLYVNFGMGSNRKHRPKAYSQALRFKNVQIVRGNLSYDTYLRHMGNAKFVLSPPGNGFDCHRTWEALLMGAAPVVLSSALDPLYYKIPAVIVDDWPRVTEKYLSSFDFSSYDNLIPSVLCAPYWRRQFLKYHSI